MAAIYRITPQMLHPYILREKLYPDLERVLFWDDTWDPDFYVALARAGFICIAHADPELGPLLLPELQSSYAVLDWHQIHYSRKLRRLMRSQRLLDERVELRIAASTERVMERLVEHHPRCWLLEPYRELVSKLPTDPACGFAIQAVELWSGRRNELVAGELGYTVGRTFTSLSGFCSPHDRELQHFGTLQMVLLADALRERGYAFWNMGSPSLEYKMALGARVLPRPIFLERWLAAR